ncbi:MAG: glycosyltransferase family 2 protein [Pyrinomonadaceae bacterium]|nr:glycosyltransferase family 2 protein [Pyrinomonadaceae bacterium]
MKKVAIVTPVHNRRELTLQCLRSLARLNSEGLEVRTYIVDDGSTDGTADAIREEFPKVSVIEGNGDLWFTEGTNVGVVEAMKTDPDYVLMINDDAVFDADFLKYMVRTAEAVPRSVVGSLLLLWDTPHRLFQVSPKWSTWEGGWRHWYGQTVWTVPEKPWEVDLIVGNCVLVPAKAIKEHGLMDSSRFPNFGDAEYTPRLKRLGWKLLIEPEARVFCQPNDMPVRLRSLSLKEKLNKLIWDLHHPHNLRRRFYAYVDGGPSYLKGSTAFVVFLFRLIFRRNVESISAVEITEPPLSETFAHAVVES